jgi:predicted ATPase
MIEHIKIENFKSIRKLDLELKPINILIGANGAGKSNFVSFFKLVNQIYEQNLQKYIGENFDKFLYFGRKKSKHVFGLIDFNNEFAFSFALEPEISSNQAFISHLQFVENPYNQDKKYNMWRILFESSGHARESGTNRKIISPEGVEYPSYQILNHYLDSFNIYHFHDTGNSSPLKQINKLDDNDYLRENGENLAAFLYYLQEKHSKDFKNIESQIRSVAPFFERFNLRPRKLHEEEIRLRWIEKGSDDYFDAYDLSDGTLRFMALTTLLLQPDLPKTIIIDEPELGLHPFAINKLAAMMKQASAKGSQVIVSTQSVNLIDNFEPEDIITVDREDDQSVFRRLNSEDLKDWLEEYTLGDLWNKNIIGARP